MPYFLYSFSRNRCWFLHFFIFIKGVHIIIITCYVCLLYFFLSSFVSFSLFLILTKILLYLTFLSAMETWWHKKDIFSFLYWKLCGFISCLMNFLNLWTKWSISSSFLDSLTFSTLSVRLFYFSSPFSFTTSIFSSISCCWI